VLDGGGRATPRLGHFIPNMTRYPLYRRLVGSQSRSGRVWKILPLLSSDPRTVQPVASRYTGPLPCPCVKPEFIYWKRNSNTTVFIIINRVRILTIARYMFRTRRSPSDEVSKKCKRRGAFPPFIFCATFAWW